jgi:predicted anti-sigma-YlaC factor YlaD
MEGPETPMTCQELVEVITDYLENRLASQDRRRFDEHLAACEGCHNYLEQIRETIRLTGRLPEESLSLDGRARLLEAFRGYR